MVKGGEADYIYLESKEFTGVTFDTTFPNRTTCGVEEGSYHYKLRSQEPGTGKTTEATMIYVS